MKYDLDAIIAFLARSQFQMFLYKPFLVGIAFLFVAGCGQNSPSIDNWTSVSIGMEKSEVEALLGKPSVVWGAATIEGNADSEPTVAAAAGLGLSLFGGDLRESWEYTSERVAESAPDHVELTDEQQGELILEQLLARPSETSHMVFFGPDEKVVELRGPTPRSSSGSMPH